MPTVLPKTVVPSHVNLRLDVDPQRDSFEGEVAIRLRASVPVPMIELPAAGLRAQRATLVTGKPKLDTFLPGETDLNPGKHLTDHCGPAASKSGS